MAAAPQATILCNFPLRSIRVRADPLLPGTDGLEHLGNLAQPSSAFQGFRARVGPPCFFHVLFCFLWRKKKGSSGQLDGRPALFGLLTVWDTVFAYRARVCDFVCVRCMRACVRMGAACAPFLLFETSIAPFQIGSDCRPPSTEVGEGEREDPRLTGWASSVCPWIIITRRVLASTLSTNRVAVGNLPGIWPGLSHISRGMCASLMRREV